MLRSVSCLAFTCVLLLSCIGCGRGMANSTSSNSPTPGASAPPSATGGGGNSGGQTGGSGGSGGSTAGALQYVYIANSGSFTVSGYQVNSDGTLAAVPGSPYLVPGQAPFDEEPESIVAVGNFLYASAANPNSSNGIAGFKINPADGSLTQFVPSTGDTGHYTFLVADAERGVVYAAGSGPGSQNFSPAVSAFKVNADGSLTLIGGQVQPSTTGFVGALALDPQGRFLYDWFRNQIYVFPRNADGSLGAQVSGSPFAAGTEYTFSSPMDPNPCFFYSLNRLMVVDQAGRFLYSTCDANGEVDEFSISNSGQLSMIGTVPVAPQGELSSLAISHDGSTLFGTQEELNQVVAFSIDRSSGKLSLASTMAAGTRPNSAAIDRSNRFLYATNGSSSHSHNNNHPGSDNMSEYAVTSAGIMTPLPNSPIGTGMNPRSVIVVSF